MTNCKMGDFFKAPEQLRSATFKSITLNTERQLLLSGQCS